ncbi:MAG: 1-acyl-sn-glycerol-3-phosphate acyltransferase [Oligoflexia bacterium]|nr:1-acyl-sn-glycerol-3-phosphate acyltransferase [Oligoflexia bacterium]
MIQFFRSLAVAALTRYFNRATVPASLTALRSELSQLVVVTQSRSLVVESLLASYSKRLGLGAPQLASQAANSSDAVTWISIHDREQLSLINSHNPQRKFTTLTIFAARGPIKTNPSHRMGFWRNLSMLLLPRSLVVVFGRPIQASEGRSVTLERLLKLDFYRSMKLVRGTPLQSVDTQMRSILAGSEFERELSIIAAREHVAKETLHQRAQQEFLKMAANPRPVIFWLLAPVARFMIRRLFAQVILEGLPDFEDRLRENTVVLVPMHRSHLDYILVGSALYDSGINPPLVAAGVNLNFWPIGFFIRSVGAYFVKRNARQDRLHGLLLRRYVTYLIKRGHLQEFFIEGGRSRSGKMRPPKLGLLNTMADAYFKGLRKDILFIPVSISYENVVEDKVYGDENSGKSKIRENALSLLRATKIFSRNYGNVIIRLGGAFSLAKFKESYKSTSKAEDKNLVGELAHELTRTIRTQSSISLSSLAYSALLTAPRYALPRPDLIKRIRALAIAAERMRRFDPSLGSFTPSLHHFLSGKESLIEELPRAGVASCQTCLGHQVYYIPGVRRFTGDFYKNATLHVYYELSFLSLLSLLGESSQGEAASQLYSLFEFELLLAPKSAFLSTVQRLAEELLTEGSLASTDPVKFRNKESSLYLPGMLLSHLQSLLWVHLNLADAPLKTQLNYTEMLARLQDSAKAAFYLGYVTRTEASSQSAIASSLEGMAQRGLVEITEQQGKPAFIEVLSDLAAERLFIERLNNLALSGIDSPNWPNILVANDYCANQDR